MLRRMRVLGSVCACAVLALGMTTRAEAVPITGGIGFAGGIAPGTDFATTNVIDIVDNVANVLCFSAVGVACTGDYAALNSASPGLAVYNDFAFNPLPAVGVTPLWILTRGAITYSFDLTNITSFNRTPDGAGGYAGITVFGYGTARITGFDATPAKWSLSAVRAIQTFRFSSTMDAPWSPSDLIFADGFQSGG